MSDYEKLKDKFKGSCKWEWSGRWKTVCGKSFSFGVEEPFSPVKNHFKYCPFCGKLLDQI